MLRRVRVALLAIVAVVGVAGLAVAAPVADKGGRPHPAKTGSSATKAAKPSKTPKTPERSGAPKSEHGKGPDATGPAAHGLCNAWSHSTQHGKSLHHSVAMRNLARAAGGYDKIGTYCAHLPAKPKGTEPDEPEPSETD
ncbi:MAG TPA: hypothetical protein VJ831_13510 [Jatrophihabitantaceae bacterium]|nr:hypothetical protein [Jatrophihabitantaceae bacterium]